MKQEPRAAYHRRKSLETLRELARSAPLIVTYNEQVPGFVVSWDDDHTTRGLVPLRTGRYEVIHAFINGFLLGRAHALLIGEEKPL